MRFPCSIAVASFKAVSPPLGSLTVSAPFGARAQGKPPVKIRYNEVVRSILYAPAYVAITNGYFKDAGLDVTLTTAQGGDKSVAALLSNSADIALIGPEIGDLRAEQRIRRPRRRSSAGSPPPTASC